MKGKRAPRLHYFCLCIVLLAIPVAVFSQQETVDSLKRELQARNLTVAKKLELYDALVYSHWEHDAQTGIAYGKKGIELAQAHDEKKWLSILYSHTAMCYFFLSQYDSAHIYQQHAIAPAEHLEDLTPLANAHMNTGSIFKMQDNLTEALASYFKALPLFEKQKHKKGEGMALGNIGQIYLLLRNFEQAEKYLKKAESIALALNDKEDIASTAIALTNIYKETDMPKAIAYAKRAERTYGELGNKYAQAISLSILGNCYQDSGDYQQAAHYTLRGLVIAKEVGYPNLLAQLLIKLSNVRYHQGLYEQCITLAQQALASDTASTEIKHNVLLNQIRGNMYLGHLQDAERYVEQYYQSVTQVANQQYQKNLSELEVQYETDKKQIQIQALQNQQQFHRWLSIAVAVILLIVLALALLRYRLAVSRRKLAEKESQRLRQEKQLVAVQATLDGETAERSRLAKDLHDGLGSMLSAVKINLPQVKGNAVLEALDVSRFQKAIGMLDDSIQELRRVAHHMMPESLVRHGLGVSLSDFCSAIPIAQFHHFGSKERLPEKVEVMVYRCIHELVNNGLKHAQASQINVQLLQEENRLAFTVQDNGKGFLQHNDSEGMGLQNIRQRVAAFQGKMTIDSSDQGTEVHVDIELKTNQ